MKKILEVSHLKKYYHTTQEEILSIQDVSFDVFNGDFVSIVGPSGCGKSTILSILSGLIDLSSGTINKKDNLKIAYMLQDDCLLPFLTVKENALLGLKVENKITDENKKYVDYLLSTYGLKEFENQYPNQLSGGMRQRVALIRTLAVKPDILLLDEAMSALDYQSRLNIEDDIYKIIKDEGKTAIMVTHDIGEAISMSDKVIVLSKRPSIIKNTYSINLDNKTTPINNRSDSKFNYYFNKIWRDLNEI